VIQLLVFYQYFDFGLDFPKYLAANSTKSCYPNRTKVAIQTGDNYPIVAMKRNRCFLVFLG